MSTVTAGHAGVRVGTRFLKGPLLILLVSIGVFAVSRRGMTHLGRWSELASFIAVVTAFAIAIGFRAVRYRDMSIALRIITRWVGIFVFAQVLFDTLGPFPGPPNILFGGHEGALYFRYAAMLGVLAGVAALWRPSFLIPLLLFYVGWRELIGTLSGIPVVDTDYLGMLDAGYFSTLGAFIAICATSSWVLQRFPSLWSLLAGTEAREIIRRRAFGLIWACAVGAHLGSYFWSAIRKLQVGGDAPLTWLLHNQTQIVILIGLERGDNPLATWPHLLQAVYNGWAASQPYTNILVFGAQILAPLAAISAPVLSFFCLAFDMFHVGVYMTLGALFFFWIGMNLVIVAGVASLPRGGFTPAMKIVMVLTTLFGRSVFYTNYLGWLDAAKLASPQFYAVTRSNRDVLIPSNYFGIYSYTIAQTGVYIPDGHYKFRIGGNNFDLESWQDALSCGEQTVVHQDTGVSLGAIENMVLDVDRMMRKYPMIKNDNLYYLYPHHMLPNPWVFTEFNDLGIDDIVGYKYVVDSVCLTIKDGILNRDVRKQTAFRFDVR